MTVTDERYILENDLDPLVYCFGCGHTRLSSDTTDGLCSVCLSPGLESDLVEELRKAEQAVINRRALVLLVKHHREEFDALVTSEREKYEAGK